MIYMDPLQNQNNEYKNLSSIPEKFMQDNQSDQVSGFADNFNNAGYRNPMPLPASLEKYRAYLPSKRIMMVLTFIVIVGIGYLIIPKIPTVFLQIKNIFSNKTALPVSKTPVSTTQTDVDSDTSPTPGTA